MLQNQLIYELDKISMRIKKLTLIILLAFLLILPIQATLAQPLVNVPADLGRSGIYTLNVPIPGAPPTFTNPAEYIVNIYNFAMGIAGLLAMVIIIFAGIKRIVSAGNPSQIGEANNMIINAAVGLALIAGAYIILKTIDPQLVRLRLPELEAPDLEKIKSQAAWRDFFTALQENREAVSDQNKKQTDFVKFLEDNKLDPNFINFPFTALKDEFWEQLQKDRNLSDEEVKKLRLEFAQLSSNYHLAAENRQKTNLDQQKEMLKARQAEKPKPGIVENVIDAIPTGISIFDLAKVATKVRSYATKTDAEAKWEDSVKSIEDSIKTTETDYARAQQNSAEAKSALDQLTGQK